MSNTFLKKGARVQLSAEARDIGLERRANRLGTVARDQQHMNYVDVLWDGLKTAQKYHRDFIVTVRSATP